MIPHELVATARVPGGGELRCYRHDGAFTIRVDGIELMSTRVRGSEEELAELAFARLGPRPAARVLVGGLGMGFTLARTLQLAAADAVVDVVELVPEVVQWNRDWFGGFAGEPLRDPRVRPSCGDVAATIAAAAGAYDIVLLDVDNGPEGLVRAANDAIYTDAGLRRARAALRPGGVLAVWSARGDPAFARRLVHVPFEVQEHRVRARRTRGPVRTIWIARRDG